MICYGFMCLTKIVATRIEKGERVSEQESLHLCFVHGRNFEEAYRINPTSSNKDWVVSMVTAFYEAHNVTPKTIEVVYDDES